MKHPVRIWGFACLWAAAGCGAGSSSLIADAIRAPDGGAEDAEVGPGACRAGTAAACVDEATLQSCVEDGGRWALREQACAAGGGCLLGACVTEVQRQTAEQLRAYVADVRARSGHPFPADYPALTEQALRVMLATADPAEGLIRGAIRFQRSYRQGHQALMFGEGAGLCGRSTGLPYQTQTFYAGVCGVPSGDGILVMGAPEGNRLGLRPGDVVVATDVWAAGPTFIDAVAAAPACNTRQGASEASDRVEAAATFFGKIDAGMALTVRGLDGVERTVEVPAREAEVPRGQAYCIDPFGGYRRAEAELTLRGDGVAVIRNSTLFPEPWEDAESYRRVVQAMIDRIGAVVAEVPDGAPIIWDIRGNSGGAAEVGLAIAAGMPGARTVEVSRTFSRVVDTDPPRWSAEVVPSQSFTMEVVDGLVTDHRDHRVAVLVDGRTASAADYFAYAAAEFTDALIVGPEGTSGSFGFGGERPRLVEGPRVPLLHRVDPLRVETPEGELLERRSVTPDRVVPYEPSDVAAGVDTVLEAAAAALRAP